mgnify:CR=1 FL=1
MGRFSEFSDDALGHLDALYATARRRTAHGSGLGKHRWMVERFFAWLHRYRRLRLRTDRDDRMHDAFLKLAVCLICLGFLRDLAKQNITFFQWLAVGVPLTIAITTVARHFDGSRWIWALLIAVILHAIGYVGSLREPRFFDLWLVKVRRCPRVKNHRIWRCNSYRP